jgi:hypothetical protein
LVEPLQDEIERARMLHVADLAVGFGAASLPYALARKYPSAARDFGWQYVLPSVQRPIDPNDGVERRHHLDDAILARGLKATATGLCQPRTLTSSS